MASKRKTFTNEWIFETFAEHPTYFAKPMFGGLAGYLFDRLMLVLVEPTKSGRWQWHGVLICTDYKYHESLQVEFPALKPHDLLQKWLFIDSSHEDFERTMEAIAARMAADDRRFGIVPNSAKPLKIRRGH